VIEVLISDTFNLFHKMLTRFCEMPYGKALQFVGTSNRRVRIAENGK